MKAQQEFLRKEIAKKEKMIAVLQKYDAYSSLIKRYEEDIILAHIEFITNKMKKK